MSTEERRTAGATRIPFEALVEVGGGLGPSFEAQAVNVSEDGMQLRTAYLPEVGQPLTFRFEAGRLGVVSATGEVVWKQEAGKGGEFGVRFVDVDPASVAALQRLLGVADEPRSNATAGSRVRLHIDGLQAPMRARVKDARGAKVTAYSDLGFLKVGNPLELEDAGTGAKRPAHIDRVEVEIDASSRVPQLVVGLRYDDATADPRREDTPEPTVIHEEPEEARATAATGAPGAAAGLHAAEQAAAAAATAAKTAIARGAAKVTPALEGFVARTKRTVALLAAKRGQANAEAAPIPLRRRTAPAPGGGLHAEGRKVVRGDSMPDAREASQTALSPGAGKLRIDRKKVLYGGSALVALSFVVAIAMHKSDAGAPSASAPTDTTTAAAPSAAPAESPVTPPASVLSPVATTDAPTTTPSPAPTQTYAESNDVYEGDESSDGTSRKASHKKGRVAPFTNGPVARGTLLRLRLDGPIDSLQGAPSANGFTVAIPGRKSLEPAAPLAAKDARIASIRVANDASGAELSVAFRDGVPNYVVRAKGEYLEIVLATSTGGGEPRPPAKHDEPLIRRVVHKHRVHR